MFLTKTLTLTSIFLIATYYVAVGGDDTLDGQSWQTAWATLGHVRLRAEFFNPRSLWQEHLALETL